MARLSVILTVTFTVIFFSLTISHARIPSNIPGNDVIGNVLPATSLPESDVVNPMIHLPSDAAYAAESHSSNDPSGETTESETADVAAIPLRLARFRPVNRHFRLQSRFPFRLCRHHHRHQHPLFKHLMRERAEIPYGDDMILSTGENSDFDPMMFHTGSGERQIPPTWVKFHHHQHEDEDKDEGMSKFLFKHSDRFGKEKFKKHMLRHHEEDEDETENEEERSKENMMMMKNKKNKKEEGGFMKRIRKILDHF